MVIADDGTADEAATEAERARQRDERGEAPSFDFGPPLDDVLATCEAETGIAPPSPRRRCAGRLSSRATRRSRGSVTGTGSRRRAMSRHVRRVPGRPGLGR